MLRTKPFAKGITTVLAAAAIALPLAAGAQDNRPVVVVFTFQNGALGPAHAEFDNISTAVQDLLITDMASNAKVRLIDIETSRIDNAQKIEGKADNVLSMISDLSTKLNGNLNLAPKPGAPTRKVGEAGDGAKSGASQSGTPASGSSKASTPAKSVAVEQYAKPQSEKSKNVKLDQATLKLYSAALDEIDKKNNAKAKNLLQQVLNKYDGWEPAQRQLKRIS
jgi:TolA-binding protein